jgi:hypothetical protein
MGWLNSKPQPLLLMLLSDVKVPSGEFLLPFESTPSREPSSHHCSCTLGSSRQVIKLQSRRKEKRKKIVGHKGT